MDSCIANEEHFSFFWEKMNASVVAFIIEWLTITDVGGSSFVVDEDGAADVQE